MTLNNIVQIEELELQLHKARQSQLSFKALAIKVFDKGFMTDSDFLVLNEAAKASTDWMDSITLNHMTILFNNQTKVA